MQLTTVMELFSAIEKTPKRLEMQALLTDYFRQATPEEGAITAYLIIGRIVPEFIAVEFQLSDKTLRTVVETLLGKDVVQDLTTYGDIGSVWEAYAPKQETDLTLLDYYSLLWDVAKTKGTGSQAKKQELLINLLKRCSPLAGKYTLRIVNSKLRLGASERTILEALGALQGTKNDELKKLFANCSDIGHTVYLSLKYGEAAPERSVFSPGIPVSAKLVEREDSIESIYKRIPEPIEEPKYDGLRIQLHVFKEKVLENVYAERVWQPYFSHEDKSKEANLSLFSQPEQNEKEDYSVMLFSRNLENMTEMFPEVVEAAKKLPLQYEKKHGVSVESIVLDGEVIGYNDIVQEYLPFQQTMTRKRKHGVEGAANEVPVKVFSFDILLVNNENLMDKSLSVRKELLTFLDENQEVQRTIVKTPIHYPKDVAEAEKLFLEYVAEGLEGVIFKDTSSIYTPGTRNFDWLKYKKAMKKELADTVDIVLVGYYRGEGKLAQFGIGALLAAVYNRETDEYLTVTKIGTGVTHEQWKIIKAACDEVKTDRKLDNVVIPKSLTPDVYLLPSLVVEVEADEITKSPLHSSGYALRFPRFKKFREKKAEQATTVDELKGI